MGVGAVKARLRAADHLDALDILDRKVGEIEAAVREAVDRHAVDEDEQMVGLGAADAQLGLRAAIADLADRDARHRAQHVGDGLGAGLGDLSLGNDGDGGADTGRLGRRLVGEDDDLGQADGRRFGVGRGLPEKGEGGC